jgi:putative pyruvate formate lyase activating enzyme
MAPNFNAVIPSLNAMMSPCTLCPHKCRANRLGGETGLCKTGPAAIIASYNVHMGEEPPISGTRGSGAIFFANCNLSCVFCQNYPISQLGHGQPVTSNQLAEIMFELQNKGVHNINFVTPTHVVPMIVEAVSIARKNGLVLPLVYNCGGYEPVETLKLLDGIIDIYLPDAKYADAAMAQKYSAAPDYPEVNKAALKEMYRQLGALKCDENGIAVRGLIIRHLVLPNNISGSKNVLEFIAGELSPETFVSIMGQYHSAHKAVNLPELSRKITKAEYGEVIAVAENLKMNNCWIQEL